MLTQRLQALAMGLLLLLGTSTLNAAGSALNKVLDSGTLRVGTTGDFNPMSFKDPETREYRGHQIDAAKQLATDMGVEIEFVPTDWKTLINGIVADKYDIVMTGTSMTVGRAKAAGYTLPWGRTGYLPLVRPGRGTPRRVRVIEVPVMTMSYLSATIHDQVLPVGRDEFDLDAHVGGQDLARTVHSPILPGFRILERHWVEVAPRQRTAIEHLVECGSGSIQRARSEQQWRGHGQCLQSMSACCFSWLLIIWRCSRHSYAYCATREIELVTSRGGQARRHRGIG